MRKIMIASALALAVVAAPVTAQVATVAATADIYRAAGSGSNGTDPVVISLGDATSITFTVTGRISVNIGTGDNFNDPDGIGSASASTNTGFDVFSGIKSPTAGFLAGVFISSAQRLTAPATLDFTTSGLGVNFASLSPLNSQVFFIGDGTTVSGVTQTFYIPQVGRAASRQLVLGLTDACGYAGGPGCFTDNTGAFAVTYALAGGTASAVPEPAAWGTMLLGFGLLGYAMRRRAWTATLGAA